jgi:hypothetical protein
MEGRPLSFFLKGAAALVALLGLTLMMEPRPEVNALRVGILCGLGLIGLKVALRRHNIHFPPRARRHQPSAQDQRSK